MRSLVPLLLLLINAAAFLIMYLDKRRAVQGRWRIPEATLLLFAALGGAAGSLLGMCAAHHKTRKWKFRILVPLFLCIQLALLAYVYLLR